MYIKDIARVDATGVVFYRHPLLCAGIFYILCTHIGLSNNTMAWVSILLLFLYAGFSGP